jgi:hypothetical protein
MASRKQFHKLDVHGDVTRRNSTVGGTVIGDYMQDGGRIIVVEMPKVEVKKAKKKGPVSKLVVDAVKRQEAPQEVTSGS